MKYRKKPIEVEAFQYDGDLVGSDGKYYVPEWAAAAHEEGELTYGSVAGGPLCELFVETPEGKRHAAVGDYIIKGINGEIYPCKPDIFEKTYCRVEENEAEQPLGKTNREPVSILIQLDNGECKEISQGICIDLAEDKENMTLLSLHVEKKEFVAAAYCMLAAVEQMGLTDALRAVYTCMTEEGE